MTTTAPALGVYDEMSDAEYHGDKTSLSSTGARKILPPGCPALFKHERDHGAAKADYFDEGHAAHALVLGTGLEIVEIDAKDWRSKAAQEERDQAHDEGKVPLLSKRYAELREMAAAVKDHPLASELLRDGRPEVSAFSVDPETWVRRRARVDWLTEFRGQTTAMDYKTTKSAEPRAFASSAASIGYHQQDPWYRDVFADCDIPIDRFIFIAQSKEPPYLVSVHEFGPADIAVGRRLNRLALDIYAACAAEDRWPGYGDFIHQMSLPRWAFYSSEETLS